MMRTPLTRADSPNMPISTQRDMFAPGTLSSNSASSTQCPPSSGLSSTAASNSTPSDIGAAGDDEEGDDSKTDDAEDAAVIAPSDLEGKRQAGLQTSHTRQDASPRPVTPRHGSDTSPSSGWADMVGSIPRGIIETIEGINEETQLEMDAWQEEQNQAYGLEPLDDANVLDDDGDSTRVSFDFGETTLAVDSSFPLFDPYYFENALRGADQTDREASFAKVAPLPYHHLDPPPPTPVTAVKSAFTLPEISTMTENRSVHFASHGAVPIAQMITDNAYLDHNIDRGSYDGVSGYDSDGETTDEEPVPSSATKSMQDLYRDPVVIAQLALSTPVKPKRRKSTSPQVKERRGPRMGSFKVNKRKSFGMCRDYKGKETVVVTLSSRPYVFEDMDILVKLHQDGVCSRLIPDKISKPKSPILGSQIEQAVVPDMPEMVEALDPTLGGGTDAAMANLLDFRLPFTPTGLGHVLHPSSSTSPFIPAPMGNDDFNDFEMNDAHSDQESEDLDLDLTLDDFIKFDSSSDSDDSNDEMELVHGQAYNDNVKAIEHDPDSSASCAQVKDDQDMKKHQDAGEQSDNSAPLMTPSSQSNDAPVVAPKEVGCDKKNRRSPPQALHRQRSGLAFPHGPGPKKRKLSDAKDQVHHRPTTRLRSSKEH